MFVQQLLLQFSTDFYKIQIFIIPNNRSNTQCSAKGLNWKKMALKRKIHGWDRMIMLNTGTALKYSNLVEVITFLGKN